MTSQVNARIDSTLKESGDRALASIGYTPTRAVRVLWDFCSKTAHDKKRLKSTFDLLEGANSETEQDDEVQMRIELVKEGPRIFERALEEMGVTCMEPSGLTDVELLEQAYRDKWVERGLT